MPVLPTHQPSRVLAELSRTTTTENGAVSLTTTGSSILNYWSKAGTYQGRSQQDVDADMSRIFSEDEGTALCVLFGLRLITRTPRHGEGRVLFDDVQTGSGRKDEFLKSLNWLARNKSYLFLRNLRLIPIFGCWKDIFSEEILSLPLLGAVLDTVRANLEDPLLLKYLPKAHRTKRRGGHFARNRKQGEGFRRLKEPTEHDKLRKMFVEKFCAYLGIDKRQYQKLKSLGTGHTFQQQMSHNQWERINLDQVPGRAIFRLSRNGKDGKNSFERHGQGTRLQEWVLSKKSIKFTGYPYELVHQWRRAPVGSLQQQIIEKQWETVLDPLRGHNLGNVLTCLDTSASMNCDVTPNKPMGISCLEVCVSLGCVFSALNTGFFKDYAVQFDSESKLLHIPGNLSAKLNAIPMDAMGSTNFQSVIDLLVRTRLSRPEIPVNEYPETLLVVSDMQFNPTSGSAETNYEAAMRKLRAVGLSDVRIIWWYVTGRGKDFPSSMNDKGVYMIGGFDPVMLKALMGLSKYQATFDAKEKKEENPMDGLRNFLSQPIFQLISR